MMVFTHVLMGALLGVGISLVVPTSESAAITAGLLGGAVPDLDMVFTHRRTFHFPVVSTVLALGVGSVVLLWPVPPVIAAFSFVLAAAVHSLTDILGGGKEMRPWRETDDRAVYNHVTDRWIAPRRVFYDGSIADLGLSLLIGGMALFAVGGVFRYVVGFVLLLGVVYTAVRRWITTQISEEHQTFSGYIQSKVGLMFGRG